jgi:HK97 family phage major capsid protein
MATTTKTQDKAAMLQAVEAEVNALSFYRTKAAKSVKATREACMAYDLTSVLLGTPNKLALDISEKLSEDLQYQTFNLGGLRSVLVPANAFARVLDAKTSPANGGLTIQSTVSRDLVPFLRAANPVLDLVTMITGLRGNAPFVAQDATATANWLPENTAVDASTQLLSIAGTMTPSRCHTLTCVSNYLLTSYSSFDMQAVVVDDIVSGIANALGYAALCGAGSAANQPQGTLSNSKIATQSFVTDPSAALLDAENAILSHNVAGSLALITSPDVRTLWRKTLRKPTVDKLIWSDDNTVLSYPAFSTSMLASGGHKDAVIIGKSSDCYIGTWGAVELLVNKFSRATSAATEIHATLLCDVLVRRPESFITGVGK